MVTFYFERVRYVHLDPLRAGRVDARMPMAMTSAGVTYYFPFDQVGSIRLVADASGTVVKRIDYDSFGSIISDSNPGLPVPFGFAGGLHDRDTGLVRFGFRDYDPGVGRWTAKDPISFASGDIDLYAYVRGNPVNRIDQWGLLSPSWKGYAGALIGTAGIAVAATGGALVVGGIMVGVGAALIIWDAYEAYQTIEEADKELDPLRKELEELEDTLQQLEDGKKPKPDPC